MQFALIFDPATEATEAHRMIDRVHRAAVEEDRGADAPRAEAVGPVIALHAECGGRAAELLEALDTQPRSLAELGLRMARGGGVLSEVQLRSVLRELRHAQHRLIDLSRMERPVLRVEAGRDGESLYHLSREDLAQLSRHLGRVAAAPRNFTALLRERVAGPPGGRARSGG